MCGIAGEFRFAADGAPVDGSIVARLNEHQRRRGPDGDGLWSSRDRSVVLGHRRLAIIDVGPSGAQPMSDATGRWTITFNGEIYNYRELRAELEQVGCRFLTGSDTEVLINLVARWGEAGLLKLRGMYAFALWDAAEQELWLVRDPYGVKPLYLAERNGTLWFASQARALASCVPADFATDPAALVGFYLWGFVPEPFSWWTGIRLLPAGHVLRVRSGRPLPASREFASIEDAYINRPMPALEAPELRTLLRQSVAHHLVADVPVGLFLSAGVDSTVLAGLATELGGRMRTVTLAFDEYAGTPEDEAPMAEETAKLLRTDHVTVRIGRERFEELLSEFLASMDQPSTDGLNTYLVSRAAAGQGLKVALSGLGGDELFGGYPSFHQIPRLLKWMPYLRGLAPVGLPALKLLRTLAPSALPPKAVGFLRYSGDIADAYILRRALHLEEELGELLDAATLRAGIERLATADAVAKAAALLTAAEASDYARVAALESGWYMRNQLLRDVDWASMAHGLEVRVPYVDPRVLDRLGPAIASSAPPSKKDLAGCVEHLPEGLLDRAKTGFTTPVNRWVRETTGIAARGLRGWAAYVEQHFRTAPLAESPYPGSKPTGEAIRVA